MPPGGDDSCHLVSARQKQVRGPTEHGHGLWGIFWIFMMTWIFMISLPYGWASERGWLVVKGGHGSMRQCLQPLLPPAAPRRPPGNISWTFSGSSLSLKWDPVVPLRNESTITGYKVRKGTWACHEEKWLLSFQWTQGPAIPSSVATGAWRDVKYRGLWVGLREGQGRDGSGRLYLETCIPQMLYQNDLHPTPTLHLTSKNWIEIPVPEDIGHALVQIRTTGPGGDGIPAEVHIVRDGGTAPPCPHLSSIGPPDTGQGIVPKS